MSGLRPTTRRTVPGSTVAALLLVLTGCSGDDDPAPTPTPEVASTPALADVAPGAVTVARGSFCDAVPDAAVEAALDGPAESSRSWDNGDAVAVAGGSDVAHEHGCAWRGAAPAAAEAWVFAPPVTTERARAVARAEGRRPGCRPLPDAAPFGEPGAALLCRSPGDDGALVASYRGLFGDAWLTCEVQAGPGTDEADLAARADRWCAAVLGAAGG
ncbi:hypothetical protein [Nocardioides taihuensis]|uniref:DUF3558 domain-containing protein n=1 Tax=Nocardioides taihuensis TaxID=1835606 RepID=A0ABW0BKZ9_9ACTN